MFSTLCHGCGAPVTSGSENTHNNVYCKRCVFDLFRECDQCGELSFNNELNYCGGSAVCTQCATDLGFQLCERCESWERSSNIIDTESTDGKLCVKCIKELGYKVCDNCRCLLKEGDQRQDWVGRINGRVNHTYCSVCAGELLVQCEDCGTWGLDADMQSSNGGVHCNYCDSMPDFSRTDEITGESFDEINTELYFGVELETHRCKHYMHLQDDKYWGAKGDPTIRGKEFDSVKMNGDEGLAAVRRLCAFAEDHSWRVDYRCGFHLHIDMTRFSAQELKAIAYAYNRTVDIWQSFVDAGREATGWCDFDSLEDHVIQRLTTKKRWFDIVYDTEHYRWLNWQAYQEHGSLELRFHEGTVDCDQVVNWIKAHTSFIDWATDVGCTKVKQVLCGNMRQQFEALCGIWEDFGHTDLSAFYYEKSNARELVFNDPGVLV